MTETENQKTEEIPHPTYDDIKDIVEYLVKTKRRNYTFGCYTPDDIAQEIRTVCFLKLAKLDVTTPREKWVNFFGRCVDNALKNLKRDRYVRAAFPDKKKLVALVDEDKSEEAEKLRAKYQKHQDNIKKKLSIRHPVPMDGLSDLIRNNKFELEMEYKDLERYLIERAPDEIIVPLKLLLSGKTKDVTRKEKRRVQAFVKKTLDQCDIGDC